MIYKITLKDYLKIGYQVGKKNYWALIRFYLFQILISVCAGITLIGIIILPAILVGFTDCALKIFRGESYRYKDSLSVGFREGMWWKSFLFCLIVIVGFFSIILVTPFLNNYTVIIPLILVIIGTYLITLCMFGLFLLADKNMTPIEVLGKSAELVHQLGFWLCFSFVIALFIFNIITYIPFGFLIYCFFFAPFLLMSWIALYENASGNLSVKSHEQITYVQ